MLSDGKLDFAVTKTPDGVILDVPEDKKQQSTGKIK